MYIHITWWGLYLVLCSALYLFLMLEHRCTSMYQSKFTTNKERLMDWLWCIPVSFIPPINIVVALFVLFVPI